MGGGMPAAGMGGDLSAAGGELDTGMSAPSLGEPSDLDSDNFGGTDAAAGGIEPVGRAKR